MKKNPDTGAIAPEAAGRLPPASTFVSKPADNNVIDSETQKQIKAAAQGEPQFDALAARARAQTRATLAQALSGPDGPTPRIAIEIRFDLRGKSAGQVRIRSRSSYLIRYNPNLLERGGSDFLRRTVPHEVAHVLAHYRYGSRIRPHGPEWQAVMRELGAEPSRCHSYDVTGLDQRRVNYFDYHCGCMDHRLSSIRHNRIAKGQRYHCRRCGEPLRRGLSTPTQTL